MQVDTTSTNAFEGAPQHIPGQEIFTGLGTLRVPENITKSPSKQARRQIKQEAFYMQHFEEWGTKFLQSYVANFNLDSLGFFYDSDSMLTFKHRSANEKQELQIQKTNLGGAEAIYGHLQIFRGLKNFHVDDFQIQPCHDKKGILITMEARLEPSEGPVCTANFTMTLAKFSEPKYRRQIGDYNSVMYVYNQVISMY
jgi:hypothetical protein